MNTTKDATVVGVFESRQHAENAIEEIRRSGFRDEQIGVLGLDRTNQAEEDDGSPGSGALAGAVAGAGVGGLVGLGILSGLIPVVGPAIAGGTLAVILANAAGGTAVGSLVGALVGWGIPDDDARYYEDEFRAGRFIITVQPEGRRDDALAILTRHGASTRTPATSAAR